MAKSDTADQMAALGIEDQYQDNGPTIDDIISATIDEAENDLDRSSSSSTPGPERESYTLESLPLEEERLLWKDHCPPDIIFLVGTGIRASNKGLTKSVD